MKHKHKKLALALAGAAVFILSNNVSADIAHSWHNLGAGNDRTGTPNDPNGTANHSTNTGEVCVFCHTPHGGDSSAAVPIWNRQLNNPSNYTTYDALGTSTFDATVAPVGSVSIACLSCHDGGQALDAVLNKPGSGGYVAANPAGGYTNTNRIGAMTGTDVDATTGQLLTKNAAGMDVVQNLGTDLRNDHPVGMQYGGGGWDVSAPRDLDFRTPQQDIANTGQWFINGDILKTKLGYTEVKSLSDGRDRLDIILYNRALTGNGTAEPLVECGSCHDPHNTDNPTFLRISNTAPSVMGAPYNGPNSSGGPSALCLTCHNK